MTTVRERLETLSRECHDRAIAHSRMGHAIITSAWCMVATAGYFSLSNSGLCRRPYPVVLFGTSILAVLTMPDYLGYARRYRTLESQVISTHSRFNDNSRQLYRMEDKLATEKKGLDYRAPWTYDDFLNKLK